MSDITFRINIVDKDKVDNKSGKDLEPCDGCGEYYYKMPSNKVCTRCLHKAREDY